MAQMKKYGYDVIPERIELRLLKFAVQSRIPRDNVRLVVSPGFGMIDWAVDGLLFNLQTYLYGRKQTVLDVRYPSTWIEAVKDRWLPKWFRRWWKVRYTLHQIDVMQVWPEIEVKGTKPIVLYEQDRTEI